MTSLRSLGTGLSLLGLSAALSAGLAPSSQARVPEPSARVVVDAASLPQGPRPAVAYVEGRTLHLPTGVDKTLPFPASHAGSLALLGPSPKGWVILDRFGSTARLFKVKGGKATKFWSTGDLSAYSWRLGFKGNRVFQLYTDRSAISSAVVFDLAGKNVKRSRFGGYGTVLAFTGDRAVVSGNKTWDWVIGSPKTAISTDSAAAADIRKNLLFLPDAAQTGFGPTTLGLPDAPEWVAAFQPRTVSPDGSYVVGLAFNGRDVEIRDMVDGALVRSFRIQHKAGFPLLWESDTKIVLGVKTSKGRALVRCGVTGPCRRATPWTAGTRALSVSFQTSYFGS